MSGYTPHYSKGRQIADQALLYFEWLSNEVYLLIPKSYNNVFVALM